MSAGQLGSLFQWIVSFFQKLIAKFNELMGIASATDAE